MSRTALRAFAFDALCVLLMVVIGTRNHKTDTGITGILFVAAPFWIAMSLTHLAPLLQRKNRRILVDDQDLALPAREFEVLWELMSPPGRTVSKRELSDKLSSFEDALADNALEAFISRLRKKLSDSGATIRTLRGIGYFLEEEKDPA